ncbi:MAG: VOC family protein [Caulobacter sp.]|nr:VOC family protein [Caulobacter sp.]
MITGLDHIAMVVHDLDAAEAGLARLLGRPANWRGGMHGARHVWFQLGNMALDVITPVGGETGNKVRERLEKHGEGLWGLGFATGDLAAAQRRMERVGITTYGPGVEVSTHPETGATREWPSFVTRLRATHAVNLFFIGHPADAAPWPVSPIDGSDEGAAVSGLDHVVVRTPNPDRAAALYGARMGLDMKLDRSNPDWGTRLMFFRCGDLVVEVAHDLNAGVSDGPDSLWGLSWRVPDVAAARARMAAEGIRVSEVRTGRKPGTAVFTVKDAPGGVPTLVIGPQA